MSAYDPKRTFSKPVRCFAVASFLSAWLGYGSGRSECEDVLRKILVIALSVGLTASAPALSHAQPGHSGAAASHENHDVQHYADLAIEPGDDGCPQGASGPAHGQNDSLCKKCCAACLGASLIPTSPVAVRVLSEALGTGGSRFDHKSGRSRTYQPNPEYPSLSEFGQPHRRQCCGLCPFQ